MRIIVYIFVVILSFCNFYTIHLYIMYYKYFCMVGVDMVEEKKILSRRDKNFRLWLKKNYPDLYEDLIFLEVIDSRF